MWLSLGPLLSLVSVLTQAHDGKALRTPESSGSSEPGVPALFSWADFDGDGRLDLAAVTADGELQLLASDGQGRFEDVTERAGLAGVAHAALALWADYDGDLRLDLFVGAREGASRLFQNEAGIFVDKSEGSGLVTEGAVQSARWLDHDGDGRLDLFVVTAETSELFRGLEGGFFEQVELPSIADAVVPLPPGPPVGSDAPPSEASSSSAKGGVRGAGRTDGSSGSESVPVAGARIELGP